MGFLVGNFRRRAVDLDYNALGGGIQNWIAGSNLNPDFRYGGLLVGSFAGSISNSGAITLSAADALASTYGLTMASAFGSAGSVGFKFIPMGFVDYSGDGASAVVWYRLSASNALAGDDSIVNIVPTRYPGGGAISNGSTASVHFTYWGFIVSSPYRFH